MTQPDADPAAGPDSIVLTRSGAVATLTFNRPAALNVLDIAMMDALVRHTGAVAADPSLRVLVLRGAGAHFMAGGDLRCFAELLSDPPADLAGAFERIVLRVQTAIENIHRMPQIAIAAVHGAVAGFGLSIATACDLVVAADNAVFASAYRHIAVTPDGGATWSLPRAVGLRRALAICLLGERFGAAEAERIGIVNRVVAPAELDAAVADIVSRIETGPRTALRNVKRLLRDAFDRPLAVQLEAEARSFAECAATPDFAEGVAAFLAKRAANFAR
ncbi:MAG: enoyl-CoA hydratase/isomerase family protein [Proteobacteria bacterium]|jgi:2-(1,2-epoxy-1,2-dihydrophenyl)acetyl-CoA isomerase|nr:enoyl-CoA hydratase/isomerase family protein [Pseudomonadota bacterium]